jgi:hypothetical protein
MTYSLTQSDVARLQDYLDHNDRAGFYIAYHELTGSEEALNQAQISSFSSLVGMAAFWSNLTIEAGLWLEGSRDLYPATIDDFSPQVAQDLLDHIGDNIGSGGTGNFDDTTVFEFSKEVWERKGVGEWLPGCKTDIMAYFSGI